MGSSPQRRVVVSGGRKFLSSSRLSYITHHQALLEVVAIVAVVKLQLLFERGKFDVHESNKNARRDTSLEKACSKKSTDIHPRFDRLNLYDSGGV